MGCGCSRTQKAFGTTKALQVLGRRLGKCDGPRTGDEVKLLNKYGGLVFDDIDSNPPVRMRVSTTKLKYIKRSGWHAMAEPPDYVGDDDDDVLKPIAITNDVLIELIKNTEQPEILNVRMIRDTNDTENEDNDGDDNSSNSSE